MSLSLRDGLAVLGLCLSIASSGAAQSGPLRDFDRYVVEALRQWRVPGVAVAVVRGDSVILAKGYGIKEFGRPEPVTPRTMFEIGSTSKAFSSAALATLVDEGKVSWDDPVTRHLPWFQLRDPFVTREVTLRDLLSHRTGIGAAYNGYVTVDRHEIVRRTRYLEPVRPFRTRYDYSNIMYSTAGEAGAAAGGKPWEQLLEERILRPLGMLETTTDVSRFFDSTRFTRCFYCPLPAEPVSITHAKSGVDVAMPHVLRDGTVKPIPWQSYDNAVSAGSVISNATEMAEWLKLLVGEGRHGGRQLIRAETFREMFRPQSILDPTGWIAMVDELSPSTHFWSYGLGWRMNDYRGRKIVWHTGGIVGFLAYVGVIPEERLGIAILSNGDLGYELVPQALALRIADLHIGAPVRDWSAELLAKMRADQERQAAAEAQLLAARKTGTRPSRPLADFAGEYRSDLYGRTVVTVEGANLAFRIVDGAAGTLEHWHDDLFALRMNSTTPGRYFTTFETDVRGQIVRMNVAGLGTFER